MKFRFGVAIVAALGLSACANLDITTGPSPIINIGLFDGSTSYEDASGEIAAKANWDAAREITLNVEEREFTPMVVHLKRETPYKLKIVNKDAEAISFRAVDFFESSSVLKLSAKNTDIDDASGMQKPLLVSFVVPAKGERTLKFVPVKEGKYEFEDASPGFMADRWHFAPWGFGTINGTFGVFIVK
ncbi:cupredoxin domain-containing protein [Terasakiella sp. A23]|uniref:cupredoxin domain-containing protein n=1 Tax=Terasakiella sp. FCG-A23 TaxID=3080561 RepID=UPI002954F412|nr:cupredoxin domain-containing protein [Terasakiella sp. A23]MDV7340728.1 cupredoxin domain-containing protein [Terasakiella sp. A23]